MRRYTHASTGVVVEVRDGKQMGPEWTPDEPKRTTATRRRGKSDKESDD